MASISADDVLRFLEKNPRFFLDHEKALRSSGLLESDTPPENVLNIRHRLFQQLNKERRELMGILDETIEVVRKNEKIEQDFLAIEKQVFHPSPTDISLTRLAEEIEERFSLDHASFLMFHSNEHTTLPETEDRIHFAEEKTFHPTSRKAITLAGNLEEGAPIPFPENCRSTLRSVAIVPLTENGELLGLLLLGSKDPGRYTEGMATHLLERLAVRLGLGIRLILNGARSSSDESSALRKRESA